MPGYLALILHAHLPFVRHPEHEHFLEEEWFFEAITETYIPLLRMMQRLVDDGVPFKLTMSLTPTLCAMLQDPLLRDRYVQHLDLLIDLSAREQKRNRKHPQLRDLADFYFDLFSENRRLFVDEWKCDLLSVFRQLREAGALEIIACAATHGVLPILQQQSPQAARAQVLIGRDVYVDLFGAEPSGFWLPECAYAPGLEAILQEANIRWFVLDAHGLLFGKPRPQPLDLYALLYAIGAGGFRARSRFKPAGLERAGRLSGRSSLPGILSRHWFRSSLRTFGADRARKQKILRREISSNHRDRVMRNSCTIAPQRENAAAKHARHFLEQRRQQAREIGELGFDPIVVAAFDAELFGHWWFEGPRFSRAVHSPSGKPARFFANHTERISGSASDTANR